MDKHGARAGSVFSIPIQRYASSNFNVPTE